MDDSEQLSTVVEDSTGDVSVKKRSRKKARYALILKQMEFYFSDANLSRDRFMSDLMKQSKAVPLEVFLSFNKIRELTSDTKDIAKALGSSQLLQVSEDRKTVSRTTEVRKKENQDDCIIYVEQLPPDANHDWVSGIFSAYGKVDYVSIPKFKNKPVNKGFAFVEFDTPEAAKKALEAFGSVGSCLPSQMPPEKLCSIATYEEINDPEKDVKAFEKDDEDSEQPRKKASKNKHDSQEFEEDELEPKTKKVKLNESATILEDEEGKDEVVPRKEAKKRKIVEVTEQEQENDNVEMRANNETHGKKKKKKRKSEEKSSDTEDVDDEGTAPKGRTDDNDNANEEEGAEDDGGEEPDESTEEAAAKKKKKRKKKHKDKKANKKGEDPTFGLQIISKYEWQRLRNKYLNLQSEKMKALKKLLAKRRYGSVPQSPFSSQDGYRQNMRGEAKKKPEKTKLDSFKPGVILKLNLPVPLMDVDSFKASVKLCEEVAYIDAKEGDTEVFLRCFSPDGIQKLVSEQKWDKMTLLEGDEEKKYWEKIFKDRKSKFQNKVRVKVRGKDKLLKRAEQELGKHIKFDD